MKVNDLIGKYINQAYLMQVATVRENKPWICSVYYVADERLRLYWLSFPTRRHSREIAQNPEVAIAIAAKTGQPVIGIQAEGTAEIVTDEKVVEKIMKDYVKKYNVGHDYYENFIAGKNKHMMYCFTSQNYVLFDEVNFPDNPRQEISI